MPTISTNVSKTELDAIREYANACGETMSNLIKRVIIKEAIFSNCYGYPKEYECDISIPDNASSEEDQIVQNTINKIRNILGIEVI